MLLLALLIPLRKLSLSLLTLGWLPIFFIALFASLSEYQQGHIYPLSSSGLPLCYASLLLSISIAAIALLKLKRYRLLSLFKNN
jgi:hypothetical protein